MVQVLSNSEILALNTEARRRFEASGDVGRALADTATAAGLTVVVVSGETTIYADHDGRLVNCWQWGQQSEYIEDGGAGFDDQVEWYREEEEEE